MGSCEYQCSGEPHVKAGWIVQGGVTKLKEYMRGLNILPHKRKRKLPPDGIPRSPCTKLRSPCSPDGTLPGHLPLPMLTMPVQKLN